MSQTIAATSAGVSLKGTYPSREAAALARLSAECAPLVYDVALLRAGVAAFPAPRDPGQSRTSVSWSPAGAVACESGGAMFWDKGATALGLAEREGRSFRLLVGPGVAKVVSFDACRRERTGERARPTSVRESDLMAGFDQSSAVWKEGGRFGVVSSWSRRSRSRMVEAFASVDWAELLRCYCGRPMGEHDAVHEFMSSNRCRISQPMPLAMLTLTYPGDFLAVAPTGKAAKRHLAMFRQRWFRALGFRLDGAWKQEYNRKRPDGCGLSSGQEAPHFHLLVPIPARVGDLGYGSELGYESGVPFGWWLARTWADVVNSSGWGPWCRVADRFRADCEDGIKAVDSEYVGHLIAGTSVDFSKTARMSDPKRLGVYFLKHSVKTQDSKEYQHNVPDAWAAPGCGPGRFWGFWGLRSVTETVELDEGDFWTVRRTLRKVAAARARSVTYSRARHAAVAAGRPAGEGVRPFGGAWAPRGRRLRTLGVGGQMSGGWIVVNDGPRLAVDLARAVLLRRATGFDNSGKPTGVHHVDRWTGEVGAVAPGRWTVAVRSGEWAGTRALAAERRDEFFGDVAGYNY